MSCWGGPAVQSGEGGFQSSPLRARQLVGGYALDGAGLSQYRSLASGKVAIERDGPASYGNPRPACCESNGWPRMMDLLSPQNNPRAAELSPTTCPWPSTQ